MIRPALAPGTVVVYVPEQSAALIEKYVNALTTALEAENQFTADLEQMMEVATRNMARLVGEENVQQLAINMGEVVMMIAEQYRFNQVRKN